MVILGGILHQRLQETVEPRKSEKSTEHLHMLLKYASMTNSKGRKQQTLKENLLYLIFETIHNLKVNNT